MKDIILASGSPRRSELLKQIGLDFQVIVSDCDESTEETEPENYVRSLSRLKAMSVAQGITDGTITPAGEGKGGFLVIGADTIVVHDGNILGKPKDAENAFEMLRSLSGDTHDVYTAVTVICTADGSSETFCQKTAVTMFELDDEEIWKYIRSGEPMDKAGSYGIQGKGAVLVEKIDGDYFNVVGLPVSRLYRVLAEFADC